MFFGLKILEKVLRDNTIQGNTRRYSTDTNFKVRHKTTISYSILNILLFE